MLIAILNSRIDGFFSNSEESAFFMFYRYFYTSNSFKIDQIYIF